jgi:riboflavin biosynthesis pyrimidine reductase
VLGQNHNEQPFDVIFTHLELMSAELPVIRGPLHHRQIYVDNEDPGISVSLGDELSKFGAGDFALVEDPRLTDRTLIIGMFVLRPMSAGWTAPILQDGKPCLFDIADWCHNISGFDGGGFIADGCAFDAYRLALQYGLSDAVLVGSGTALKEGVSHDGHPGYLWQPYGPASWPHVAAAEPELDRKLWKIRQLWQHQGLLSSRRYPAQIVVTRSGRCGTDHDIFDAHIFHAKHPDGSSLESYILTSQTGAECLRSRAAAHEMQDRIDSMLIVCSPDGKPDDLDIAAVPRLLRQKLDIRIANHDGGCIVLSEFSRAGALAQVNFTLMRGRSMFDVYTSKKILATASEIQELRETLASRCSFMFTGDRCIPRNLRPISILVDDAEGCVVVFDARKQHGF